MSSLAVALPLHQCLYPIHPQRVGRLEHQQKFIAVKVQYPAPLKKKSCLCFWSGIGTSIYGWYVSPESLSPSDPSGHGVVLAVPSSKVVEGNPVSMGYLFPTESLGSIVVLSGKGTMLEETEWDCSKPSVGLDGVTLVSVGGFLDLGFCLFLKSAPEASGPYD
ncbi:hypothetical protein Tco_1417617 [Tanacetum coccineum]